MKIAYKYLEVHVSAVFLNVRNRSPDKFGWYGEQKLHQLVFPFLTYREEGLISPLVAVAGAVNRFGSINRATKSRDRNCAKLESRPPLVVYI